MEIQPIQEIAAASPVSQVSQGSLDSQSARFVDVLVDVVNGANMDQVQADQALADLSSGKTDDLQSVVMSVAKADLSFRFFLEMRNKLTESYQDLSRMQF